MLSSSRSGHSRIHSVPSVRFGRFLAVAGVVALTGGIAAPAIAEAGTAPAWVIQSIPSPGRLQGTILAGVSCSSARNCAAVGGYARESGAPVLLAERWNGAKWTVQAMPRVKNGFLAGISCSSARACTAVGYDPSGTVAVRWNGRKWALQRTQNLSGAKGIELVGVSCSSRKACTAVGDYRNRFRTDVTLAERWNGTRWVIQDTLNVGTGDSYLAGVSCSSAASCTAVGESMKGSRSYTLAEHWNGKKWAIQPTPEHPHGNDSELAGVSCRSAKACMAVGTCGNCEALVTLAERWNGRTWVVESTPNPSGFNNPSGTSESDLAAVSCSSANSCTAAGDYYNRSGIEVTLAEYWNGTSWALRHTPNPSGADISLLTGVSCSSANACTSVGIYGNKSWPQIALSERRSLRRQ